MAVCALEGAGMDTERNREEYVGHRQGGRHFHAPEASGEKAEGKC